MELYTCPPDGAELDSGDVGGPNSGHDGSTVAIDAGGAWQSTTGDSGPATGPNASVDQLSLTHRIDAGSSQGESEDAGTSAVCHVFTTAEGELRANTPADLLAPAATTAVKALSVVYASEPDLYAIIYQAGESVFFSTIDTQAKVVTPPIVIPAFASPSRRNGPQLTWSGTAFYAVVDVEVEDSSHLKIAKLDVEGGLLEEGNWTSDFDPVAGYRIVGTDDTTWVLWRETETAQRTVAQRTSEHFLPLGNPTVLPDAVGQIGTYFEQELLVAWTTSSTVELQALAVQAEPAVVARVNEAGASAPVLDRQHDTIVLAWQRSNSQLRHMRVNSTSGKHLCGPTSLDAEARLLGGLVGSDSEDLVVTARLPSGPSLTDLDYSSELFIVDRNCKPSSPIPFAVSKVLPRVAHSTSTAMLTWVEKQDEASWQIRYQLLDLVACN